MKLPELKRRFVNRYTIRIAAGVLTVTLLGTGMTAAAVRADQKSDLLVSEENAGQKSDSSASEENAGREADSSETAKAAGHKSDKQAKKGASDGEEDDANADTDAERELSELVSIEKNDGEVGKEENVYLISDAAGAVRETIVTNHLANREGAATIADRSELKDIENTKGNETYSADGEKLTWQADGRDIYYRGTTKKEAPVTQKVTYYLDGKEIAPDELAGKSGRVTIRFDYDNQSAYTAEAGGEDITVKVPFAAVTALVLDDRFSNVQVTNGKLESNGGRVVAIGYALPGIQESLDVEDSDFVGELELPEYFEVTADVENFEMDTAMTVVANAGTMLSMKQKDGSALDDMVDELMDASDKLKDGSSELADGLDTLKSSLADYASGMNELYSKSGDLAGGVNALNTSAASISKGLDTLDKALNTPMSAKEQEAAKSAAAAAVSKEFKKGKTKEVTEQIYTALRYAQGKDGGISDGELYSALYDGAYSANAAASVYNEVVRQTLLAAAGQSADSGLSADQAAAAIKQQFGEGAQAGDPASTAMYAVTDGMTSAQLAELLYAKSGASDTLFAKTQSAVAAQLAAGRGNEQIRSAVEQSLSALASQLAGACEEAASQAAQSAAVSGAENAKKTVASQIEAVQKNGYSLVSGAKALSKGTQTLADQIPALTAGITALNDATGQLVDGVGELNSGSHELADGMVEFDEEGISKIVNSYNGDIKPLTNRLQAVLDAGEDYQSFSGVADGVSGSVKFVYKLDAVKASEGEE